jgi:hypothetical protein
MRTCRAPHCVLAVVFFIHGVQNTPRQYQRVWNLFGGVHLPQSCHILQCLSRGQVQFSRRVVMQQLQCRLCVPRRFGVVDTCGRNVPGRHL